MKNNGDRKGDSATANDELDGLSFYHNDGDGEHDRQRSSWNRSSTSSQRTGQTTSQTSPPTGGASTTSLAAAVAASSTSQSQSQSSQPQMHGHGSSDTIDPALLLQANNTPMGGRVPEGFKSAPVPNFYRSSRSSNVDEEDGQARAAANNEVRRGSNSTTSSNRSETSKKSKSKRKEVTPLLRPTPTPIVISYPPSSQSQSTTNGHDSQSHQEQHQEGSGLLNNYQSNNWIPPSSMYDGVNSNNVNNNININAARKSNLRTTLPRIIFRVRLVNLVTTTLTIFCMSFTLWTKLLDLPQLVLSIYSICFCALLCAHELHIRWYIADLIHDNFGILSSPYGRAFYIVFCGCMCLTQGLLPFIFGWVLLLNGIFNIYVICKYPDYRRCEETTGREDVRNLAATSAAAGATSTGWSAPSWATAGDGGIRSDTTYGSSGYGGGGGLYGSTSTGGGATREFVDEEHERLLNAPALAGPAPKKGNPLTACMPKKKKCADLHEAETNGDDEINEGGAHIQ